MQYRGVNYSNRMQAENAKHGQEADMAHRIYYIEDDAGIAEGVAFFLRRKGFEVITAATVAEGKQLLGKGLPSVVLVDWNLPDGSGFDFARKVLATEECDMLILDEILGALEFGIVSDEDILGVIGAKSQETELIMTGNIVTDALKNVADRVVSLEIVK